MPCYDNRADKLAAEMERLYGKAHHELVDAVRAACEMARSFRAAGVIDKLSKSTQEWIKMHDKFDSSR